MKNISKGQKLSLEKELSNKSFTVALNWEQLPSYDIDTSILLLGNSGKLEKEENFIFYNNLTSPCGGVKIDNVSKAGYKKTITLDLSKISNDVSRIMFILTIDNGDTLNQRFENVKNISATILENSNSILDYKIEDLTKETALILVEIYKHNNEWKIQATGNGFNSGLAAILEQYGSDSIKVQEEQPIEQKVSPNNTSQNNSSINNDFVSPVVNRTKNSSNKVPKGSPDFIREYNKHLEIVKRHLAANNLTNQNAQVIIALDLSWSMSMNLRNGNIQETFEKVLPMAIQLDDDGIIDVFPFHDEAFNHNVPFTMENHDRYIQQEILFKYHLAGANYAPVIRKILEKYSQAGKNSDPVYVLFITDGDCADHQQAESAIKDASSKGIFWQFIGIGENKSTFKFLNKLDTLSGRKIDNANFFSINDLSVISDDELYKKLLAEFPFWLKNARQQGVIN